MAKLILSVTGSDRPGLTQALAAAVLSAGGNWLESHLSRLGGLYVGSVLVELVDAGIEPLRAAIRAVDAHGLEVRITPSVEGANQAGEIIHFNLVGADQPGIVHQVTAALTALAVNIETFQSEVAAEPHSGAPLFHMNARLRLPPALSAADVQAALEGISAEIMVDISLTAAD